MREGEERNNEHIQAVELTNFLKSDESEYF